MTSPRPDTLNQSTLVQRLRAWKSPWRADGEEGTIPLAAEAADTIGALCEALREIERLCSEYEHINLVGKTPKTKKAGTIRNVSLIAQAAIAKVTA